MDELSALSAICPMLMPVTRPEHELRAAVVAALVVVLLVAGAVVGSWAWWRDGAPGEPAADRDLRAEGERQRAALGVLTDWNARRASAWARGDPEALTALYAGGVATGRADVERLRRWRERGLVVDGLTTQILRARVRTFTGSRLSVEVTERVASAVARPVHEGARGRAWALPRDGPDTSVVTMHRVGRRWVLVSATPVSGRGPDRSR